MDGGLSGRRFGGRRRWSKGWLEGRHAGCKREKIKKRRKMKKKEKENELLELK